MNRLNCWQGWIQTFKRFDLSLWKRIPIDHLLSNLMALWEDPSFSPPKSYPSNSFCPLPFFLILPPARWSTEMRLFIAANFPDESEVETSISANPLSLFLSFPSYTFHVGRGKRETSWEYAKTISHWRDEPRMLRAEVLLYFYIRFHIR